MSGLAPRASFPKGESKREADMRDEMILLQIACVGAVMAMTVGVAGSDGCCSDVPSVPRVVYALPPTPTQVRSDPDSVRG